MNAPAPAALFQGAALPLRSSSDPDALLLAGRALVQVLAGGKPVDAATLRATMESAFGASDAAGAWVWKDAYEAGEVAQVLFLRRFWAAIRAKAPTPTGQLAMLARIASMLPSHTRRSEESVALQQFSTPLPLAHVVNVAAGLTSADLVLEPSAGTGILAIFAQLAGAKLVLNELAETRAGLLTRLFPGVPVTRHDAEQIDDRLDAAVRPTVVVMNPPFSASYRIEGRHAASTYHHIRSALARLVPGGRLVAVTGEGFSADRPAWREAFAHLAERGAHLVFSAGLAGGAYARHGTTAETRLSVFDQDPVGRAGTIAAPIEVLPDTRSLLEHVTAACPPRLVAAAPRARTPSLPGLTRKSSPPRRPERPVAIAVPTEAVEVAYEVQDGLPPGLLAAASLYEPYTLQSIRIPAAHAHPTKLVESAAMASVSPPKPTHRPLLPATVVGDGLLSDVQLETVIFAGQAHANHLPGWWTLDETFDTASAAPESAEGAVRFRQGYFLGDGTGVGKGRQAAGIILDNWMRGRRRAIWVSKSDALLEDAQRDWGHLGQERLQVIPLSRFPLGTRIGIEDGILFTTFSTLRSEGRGAKASRLDQIVEWCGPDFDGVVILDEAHKLANAAGGTGERGDVEPSQQGRAGLRLQHRLPDARITYVSATGGTKVQNLAYASRLGMWGGANFPFATRADFVGAIEAGGIAAMEVLARDLKTLGLYAARSLSYEGVEVDMLVHDLTPAQIAIYDAYADAFQVIHANLAEALRAANVTGAAGASLNRQAKAAARSAFESNKQRFFAHLLTAMKCPSLLPAIEQDLAAGHAAVVQIVSTSEALMERRIADIPASEWSDLSVDITPREYVLDYLAHSFPTQLYEAFTDGDGNLQSRPATDEAGNPVQCREALERRQRMIEHLSALPPVQGALDQLVQHFGTDQVAEVTGRSRRIVRRTGSDGAARLALENRPNGANLAETQAFMDDEKRVLVFSDAGGTGRSYHADLRARNQRLRVHYLLEPGWKADNAVQGLGRTNRTNQAQPPRFRPVATNVQGEKRFLSTIARRLDSLGAITRGQRQTGGQGLFRPEDNLESPYGRAALRQFYVALYAGRVEGCSLVTFQEMTGLDLTDRDGTLREDLPPISVFLNRCLALRIATQNLVFGAFAERLEAVIEGAIASGTYDVGLEVLTAESFRVEERRVAYTHPATGAEALLLKIAERRRVKPLVLDEALEWAAQSEGHLVRNPKTGRAAVVVRAPSDMLDDGSVIDRVRLVRPLQRTTMTRAEFGSRWKPVSREAFIEGWQDEVAALPEFENRSFHMITGLLLPVWNRLPSDEVRVYRLITEAGERLVGRLVAPEALDGVRENLGLAAGATLEPAEAWTAALERGTVLHLAGGLQVRRTQAMGARRLELVGFEAGSVEGLKAIGLTSEIIQWKLRLFLPVTADGPNVLGRLVGKHPIVRCLAAAASVAA